MPDPKKDESKEEFIARFMGSEEAKKSFPDKKQRLAVANSKWEKKSKHKETPINYTVIKIKESEDEDGIKSYTFIAANTLPDRAQGTAKDGTPVVGEILSKSVLEKIASKINDTTQMGDKHGGSYRTISLFHDRVYEGDMRKEEAGYIIPGSAIVQEISGATGNFELVVGVEVNKLYQPTTYPDYTPEKIHYKIEKGALGLSLEYNNLASQETVVDVDGEKYNYVFDTDDFRGFGFARPNLIGNTGAVRVKEITISEGLKTKRGTTTMADKDKLKEMEQNLEDAQAKIKELTEKQAGASKEEAAKLKEQVAEHEAKVEEDKTKLKEMKLELDDFATKIKESFELGISSMKFPVPAANVVADSKVKEAYAHIDSNDFIKFKEAADAFIDENGAKLKQMLDRHGEGFDFERWQTVKVKCAGSQMIVIPSTKTKEVIAKTKDVIDATDMAEGTFKQTNAFFADRYVSGITETFLKSDNLLTAINKEQHIGGNDYYQYKLWVSFGDVDGTNTAAVNPNVTSVATTQRNFEKMQTRICEYRDAVEVSDFVLHHAAGAIGDLLGLELERAAQWVTNSMNADLYKGKVDATSAWYGFAGLIGYADSSSHGTMYGGKTRSATNRLLDATTANTYVSTSEAISIEVVRAGIDKVLAHGSARSDLLVVMHPTQYTKIMNSQDAGIRHNILTMGGAPPSFGFNCSVMPYIDGRPILLDYHCESSAGAQDMFGVIDMSTDKGLSLIVSKPLGARGLAKVGTTEKVYVSFYGCTVYKSPRNIFVHDSLTT